MDNNAAFLKAFENTRLGIENVQLHLPEAAYLMTNYHAHASINPQDYLHALPTLLALMKTLVYSPRTVETINTRFSRAGAVSLADNQTLGRILSCFGIARLYRLVSKSTNSPEFAQVLAKIACLSLLDSSSLEQVDWAVKVNAHSRKAGNDNWLAPALLFTVWATHLESPGKAREIAGLLDQFNDFVKQAWIYAFQGQIYMGFPW